MKFYVVSHGHGVRLIDFHARKRIRVWLEIISGENLNGLYVVIPIEKSCKARRETRKLPGRVIITGLDAGNQMKFYIFFTAAMISTQTSSRPRPVWAE